jgi:hypothetical protein
MSFRSNAVLIALATSLLLCPQVPGIAAAQEATAEIPATAQSIYATNNGTFNGNTILGIVQYTDTSGLPETLFAPVNTDKFIVTASRNIYVDGYYTDSGEFVSGVGLLAPGSISPAPVVSQQCSLPFGPALNPVAISANGTHIFVADCDQSTGVWGVYEYLVSTQALLRVYPSFYSSQEPVSMVIDGGGHLWVAWSLSCCTDEMSAFAEYAQNSTTPLLSVDIPRSFLAAYVDGKGTAWSLQNGDFTNAPDFRYFLPGQCVYDPDPPHKDDDVRAILMQRFSSTTPTLYFSTPYGASTLGDGDGTIRWMAVAPNGYAYLAYDTGGPPLGAGVNLYKPVATGYAEPVCPEISGNLKFPGGTNPAIATDSQNHLFVGLAEGVDSLEEFSAGATPKLIKAYPGDFSGDLLEGGNLVIR